MHFKKTTNLFILLIIGFNTYSQTIIKNPAFSASTDHYVEIERIELSDTVTKMDFKVTFKPGWWIRVYQDKTYIQNSDGGNKLYVKRADGIELNKKHTTPENGINRYTLYFPALGKNTEKIDFLEEEWKIFDIDITGVSEEPFIPREIQGNWFKTDGSGEWVYGIYNDKIIYDSQVWDKILINKKGKRYELLLKNESNQKNIYIKLKKENLLIGDTPENQVLYAKRKTVDPAYVYTNDKGYEKPIFHADTAIYKGYIDGYHKKMGSTGAIHVNNILKQKQDTYVLEIEGDGSFVCKIPMVYPEPVYLRLLGNAANVYLEPAKETFQYINLPAYSSNYTDINGSEMAATLFMGDLATLNSNMHDMRHIRNYDHKEVMDTVLSMSADDYKSYCLDILAKDLSEFENYTESNPICKKAMQIKELGFAYDIYREIFSFNRQKSYAYRKKHKIPREQREIPLEPEELTPAYFSFLDASDLNNPLSLTTGGSYYYLINRIRFADEIRPKSYQFYNAFKELLIEEGVDISDEELNSLNNLIQQENQKVIVDLLKSDSILTNLFKNHKDLRKESSQVSRNKIAKENLNNYFGIKNGLVTDIIYAQSFCHNIENTFIPVDEHALEEIRSDVGNDFIVEYLIDFNTAKEQEFAQKLEENKTKSGFVINETPKVKSDKIFDEIIGKYIGNLVFVDFWATWCSPCRSGIEKIKPLKEELKNEDISFVYITNPSSPEELWNMMIPDIAGEHYRIDQDQWNYLSAKFNISGIPRYMLISKSGEMINDQIRFYSSLDDLKKLLIKHL